MTKFVQIMISLSILYLTFAVGRRFGAGEEYFFPLVMLVFLIPLGVFWMILPDEARNG